MQRLADAGATWRTEVTGATETLAAGAAPSASVCWLVGPGGMVFLSTDGRTGVASRSPSRPVTSFGVATDDENSTVTAADGRRLSPPMAADLGALRSTLDVTRSAPFCKIPSGPL